MCLYVQFCFADLEYTRVPFPVGPESQSLITELHNPVFHHNPLRRSLTRLLDYIINYSVVSGPKTSAVLHPVSFEAGSYVYTIPWEAGTSSTWNMNVFSMNFSFKGDLFPSESVANFPRTRKSQPEKESFGFSAAKRKQVPLRGCRTVSSGSRSIHI